MLVAPGPAWRLAALTVFPTALAFYWMNVFQPRVSASRAALVYLLEPVFAAAVSVATGHDRWTVELVTGGGLIVAGNLFVELPAWLRERRRGYDGPRSVEPTARGHPCRQSESNTPTPSAAKK
jgi:drug/metabolite transporter (DMT)-like permease